MFGNKSHLLGQWIFDGYQFHKGFSYHRSHFYSALDVGGSHIYVDLEEHVLLSVNVCEEDVHLLSDRLQRIEVDLVLFLLRWRHVNSVRSANKHSRILVFYLPSDRKTLVLLQPVLDLNGLLLALFGLHRHLKHLFGFWLERHTFKVVKQGGAIRQGEEESAIMILRAFR